MTPTRHIAAVLTLATVAAAAVGCSKRDEAAHVKAEAPEPAAMKRVLTSRESVVVPESDGEGAVTTPAAISRPVSYADGEIAYHAGKYAEAAVIFERYTGQRPNNAWGHYMLGLSAWKSGDLAKADQAFERALIIDPHHLKSLLNSSRVFIDQKRYDDAVDRLTRASDLDPASADAYRLLGRAHHSKRETDKAVEAYQKAIELNERDAWSLNNLGLVFLETQRPHEALPLLTRAVELRQDVPAFHNNLGMALEHTGQFGGAATAYAGALAADPAYQKAGHNLARLVK